MAAPEILNLTIRTAGEMTWSSSAWHGGRFRGVDVQFREGDRRSLPQMLHGASISVGEEVTAGFSITLADGKSTSCWISAKLVDGRLEVRSWTEGAAETNHRIENPNPYWFSEIQQS